MIFSGRSMRGGSGGGGGGGGGGVLRTFGRAVTRVGVSGNGIQDPFSSSTSTNSTISATTPTKSTSSLGSASPASKFASRPKSPTHLSLSSPVNSHTKSAVSGSPLWYSSPEGDDLDWVTVDGYEDEGFHSFTGAYVLGNVPSEDEVENAVSALQKVFCSTSHVPLNKDNSGLNDDVANHVTITGLHVSTDGPEMDWKEPCFFPCDSRMRLSNESDRVYHAFHLLQTEPTVQKMVKSLSSDKAVWDAVLNNEAVREFQESFSPDDEKVSEGTSRRESDSTTNVVMWLFDNAKAKFMELIENITKIMTDLFQPSVHERDEDAGFTDPFTEKLRTSFMLSIMVLLVVVVSRAQRA